MASFSVKNRVAMFEHGGNDEDRGPISPTGRSFKRPSTPTSQPFKRPTTPNVQALRPTTPNGPSFLRPATPTGKSFNRASGNDSPKANRASWPWPSDDNVIPVPRQEMTSKQESSRRYSSPYVPNSDKPAILPSPKAKLSGNNTLKIQSMLDASPLKHIQNQETNGSSFPRKTPGSPVQMLQRRFDLGTAKPVVLPTASRASPLSNLSKSGSLDENKAPRVSDVTNQRSKALQLAKSRNSFGSSIDAKNLGANSTASNATEDDSSAGSSHSSNTNNELSNIANQAMFVEKDDAKSIGTDESPAVLSAPGGKQSVRLSRAGKLSQANRRVCTPDSAPDIWGSDTAGHSQSPLPAVRGARTLSKVSHQEARKALLQAAQRKKEKADAAKQIKDKTESAKIEEHTMENDNSSKSQRSTATIAADRLALKAANVLAIKNSSKILFGHSINTKMDDESFRDTDGSVSGSVISTTSEQKRRMNHPAFAARSSPKVSRGDLSFPSVIPEKQVSEVDDTAKLFSEELFSSFRHFNELRPEKNVPIPLDTTNVSSDQQAPTIAAKALQGRPPHPHSGASPMSLQSPKSLKDAMAVGSGSVLQSFDYSNASPKNTDSNTGRFSIDSSDSPFMEQEESLHSTSDRNFDRRFTDLIGNPKYAPPRQMFQQQEGGYLSSLSTNTHSTTSMISTVLDAPSSALRIGTETPNPLGEMSPRMSMRSGHSLAQSIISMSPRVENSKQNSDFEYLLNTPSGRTGVDTDIAGKTTPSGVPPQIVEEEVNEPSVGPSVEAPSEPTVGSSLLGDESSNGDQNAKSTTIPIQMSYSAAEAPPGFVFHDEDTEGSEGTTERNKIPDPDGRMSFDVQGDTVKDGREDIKDDVKCDTAAKFNDSTSTKGTISTSLRTGLSSVQNGSSSHRPPKDHVGEDIHVGNNESQREGSTSIRTGLSGLQNTSDLEGSASMRSVSVSMKSTGGVGQDSPVMGPAPINQSPKDPPQLLNPPPPQQQQQQQQGQPKRAKVPDTIVEGDDEEASGIKSRAEERPTAETSLLGPQSTATTDYSSRGSGPPSDRGKNEQGSASDNQVKTPLPAALAPINTRPDKNGEDPSIASSPASSKHSRWKVKMPNMIKNVLAKASPRSSAQTPKGKMIEKTGFSTSEEEDDDIFGGLEDDLSKVMGEPPKKPLSTKSGSGQVTAKRPSSHPPTPNRFFHSGHSRKTEPPRITEPKEASASSRRSVRSETRGKPIARRITPENKLSLKGIAKRLKSPKAAESTPYGLYSNNNNNNDRSNTNRSNNDRSGTFLEQEVVQEVNSDITSSIIAGPFQKLGKRPKTPMKADDPEDEIAKAKTPKAKTSKTIPPSTKSESSKKGKTPKMDNHSVSIESKKTNNSKGKETLLDEFDGTETETKATKETLEEPTVTEESTAKEEKIPSMFMNLGCGLSDAYSALASVCHFGAKDDDEPEVTTAVIDDEVGTFISADSNNTSSHLTELEKRVWNEWDKLDSAFSKATKSPASEKKEELDKKREVARGKLLEIANSAISSQMTKEGDQSRASASYTTGSSSDSGDTGQSSGMTGSTSEGHSSGESRSYVSGASDIASDMFSLSVASKATATPILLSFSQRSLIEKFSKQLGNVGVEVLKLNRRKQWQVRYFTVSKEQIALIAHEANSKSGAEVAQCPKALLWLKKFNAKGGGYSLANIDKSGHGGMLLVDLKDIHVSPNQDMESPIPKKLADKFKDSVLVTFEYQFNGEKRRIEFRCKDNDEAQFLCTCMRVIRDLLKREQTLRQKTQQAKTPKK